MSSFHYRCVVLIAVLAAAGGLLLAIEATRTTAAPRAPDDTRLFAVEQWTAGPAKTEMAHGVQFVERGYRRDGLSASLAIATSSEAKRIYRAGAEVPFLGSGYTVNPAPPSLVPPAPGRSAMILHREQEAWLLLSTYGERRGLLGSGPLAWGMVAVDALLGRPNDYYLLRLLAPLDRLDGDRVADVVALADTLFPRLAAWYAH
jgi:hypothetical protein